MAPLYSVQSRNHYDKKLITNVHPADWINPIPAECYNLVVIGAGTAGLVTAAGAAGLGAKVALIEKKLMGGDCLNVGCVPSKGIIRSARAIYDVKTAAEYGITGGRSVSINFSKAMERMRRIRAEMSIHDSAERFSKELGVDVFFGKGRFIGSDSIEVDGKQLRFKKAAICTGARAATLSISGIEKAGYFTNETVFQLTKLPRRLTVIGGGPLGCELSQAFARMGSQVTLLEQASHILPREDADAAEVVQRAFLRDGIKLRLQATVIHAAKKGREKTVTFEQRGKKVELLTDEILAGVGRAPNVEGLDLESAGIDYDRNTGVKTNDFLQTSNPCVYAAGDICSSYKFTHTADAAARIVIANALFLGRQKASALVIPWCTYTDPEVAHVGMYRKEASEKGIAVSTITIPLADSDRALLDSESEGFAKIHLKKGSDTILGATVVARHAGEMINEITLAMTSRLGLKAIGRTIHPYPAQSEVIKKAADAYYRTRLTPVIKKLISAWLKWRRL